MDLAQQTRVDVREIRAVLDEVDMRAEADTDGVRPALEDVGLRSAHVALWLLLAPDSREDLL